MRSKMTKKIIIFILALGLIQFTSSVSTNSAYAQTAKKKSSKKSAKIKKKKKSPTKKSAPKAAAIAGVKSSNAELQQALSLAKSGNYEEASLRLFNLSRSPRYTKERMQIKYLLG